MKTRSRGAFLTLVLMMSICGSGFAHAQDISASSRPGEPGDVGTLALGDTRADLVFTPLSPCRIIDTRLTGLMLPPGFSRPFKVAGGDGFTDQGGTSGGCGVPVGATAVLINFVAVNPTGAGNLRGSAYPNEVPTTGSIINYQALAPVLNIANGLVFPICDTTTHTCTSDIYVLANGAATHLVADVMGYMKRFPKEETITAVTAGTGLTGGGSAGPVTLGIADGGVGTNEVANDSLTAADIGSGAVGSDEIANNAILAADVANGQVVRSLNGITDSALLTTSGGAGITTVGNTINISAPPPPPAKTDAIFGTGTITHFTGPNWVLETPDASTIQVRTTAAGNFNVYGIVHPTNCTAGASTMGSVFR